MANRTAKIASIIVAGILTGAPLIMPRDVANAAECLTEPGKEGARGQHWYYRIEHGTKRHCWYLRDGEGKSVQTAPADDSEPAPKAAAQSGDNSPRALEDARAEYPMPQTRGNTIAAPAPGPAPLASSPFPNSPQADAAGSAVAARWPSPESTIAPAAPAPAAPALAAPAPATAALPAPSVVADATDSTPAAGAVADAPSNASASTPAPAATPTAPAKPSVSLQMLFAVIGGALALAGLTASIVYRLGRRKQRRLATSERRAVLWESVENGPRPPWVPPEIEEEPAPRPLPERRAPPSTGAQKQRYDKIEELLEQLVRHGQQSDA